MDLTRRSLLGALASLPPGTQAQARDAEPIPVLRDIAARKSLQFGTAVDRILLQHDQNLARLVATHCATLVPQNALKWGVVEAVRGREDYSEADWISDFARKNGLQMRGHVLAWHQNIPRWVAAALRGVDGATVLRAHVASEARHFSGRIESWDVVNELVWPPAGRPDGLAPTILLQSLGVQFIADSFAAAREADPHAVLYYNEGALEYGGKDHQDRRKAVLTLLAELNRRGVPVQGLGIQSHLTLARSDFHEASFRAFLKDVADMGLAILISELDIDDHMLRADDAVRDARVADMAAQFLAVALDEPAVKGVLTWGLSDRDSFLNNGRWLARNNGRRARPLPLDENMRPKPFWFAMARAFANAPMRA